MFSFKRLRTHSDNHYWLTRIERNLVSVTDEAEEDGKLVNESSTIEVQFQTSNGVSIPINSSIEIVGQENRTITGFTILDPLPVTVNPGDCATVEIACEGVKASSRRNRVRFRVSHCGNFFEAVWLSEKRRVFRHSGKLGKLTMLTPCIEVMFGQ